MTTKRPRMRHFIWMLLALAITFVSGRGALALDDIVQNGSFEIDSDSDGIPDRWSGRHLGPSDIITTEPFDGTYSFRILGEAGVRKSLRQKLKTELPQGTHIIFSAYSKVSGSSGGGGVHALKVELIYEDFTSESFLLPFSFSEAWERVEQEVVLLKKLRKVIITLVYGDQTGTAWFDLVQAGFFRP